MKKLILSIILTTSALINAEAIYCQEQNNWYAQANGSFGWHNKSKFSFAGETFNEKQDHGFGGSIAIGRIIEDWRLELEASFRESSSKSKFYTSNSSLMLNAYYDIPVMEDVSFYIGAGAGISSVNGKVNSTSFHGTTITLTDRKGHLDTVFAWQLMAGVSYALDENWDLIAGYRLFATTKPTLEKTGNDKLKMSNIPLSNNLELGLRFKF